MDSTFEITVSAEAAQNLIPCLKSRIEAITFQIEEKHAEIEKSKGAITFLEVQRDSAKTTLAELTAKLEAQKPVIRNGKFQQRLPKGYGEKLILDLLASLPSGQGLTMSEIEEKTGVNHATVFRTFKQSKRNNGRFVSKKGKWRLAELNDLMVAGDEPKNK